MGEEYISIFLERYGGRHHLSSLYYWGRIRLSEPLPEDRSYSLDEYKNRLSTPHFFYLILWLIKMPVTPSIYTLKWNVDYFSSVFSSILFPKSITYPRINNHSYLIIIFHLIKIKSFHDSFLLIPNFFSFWDSYRTSSKYA